MPLMVSSKSVPQTIYGNFSCHGWSPRPCMVATDDHWDHLRCRKRSPSAIDSPPHATGLFATDGPPYNSDLLCSSLVTPCAATEANFAAPTV